MLKKSFNTIDWNKWSKKDREEEIKKEIDKIAPPWVKNEEEIILNDLQQKDKNTDKEHSKGTQEHEDIYMNKEFQIEEIYRAIQSTKEKSAPGRDNIEYRMIKELTEVYIKEILKIFNWCYKEGKLMEEWKETQTIFIDKGDKEKVRPITLSSCMGKVLERMINERLIWWAESRNFLDKNQNGFRRGKSTVENLTKIVADIEISFRNNEHTLAAFLDITSAYDNVLREVSVDIMKKNNCPSKIVSYVSE